MADETDEHHPLRADRSRVPARIDADRALSILATHFHVGSPGSGALVFLDFLQADAHAATASDTMVARVVIYRDTAQALVNDLSALLADG